MSQKCKYYVIYESCKVKSNQMLKDFDFFRMIIHSDIII